MKSYWESRHPVLSVLGPDPSSRDRKIIRQPTVGLAKHNQTLFPRLEPVFGWEVRRYRFPWAYLTGTPKDSSVRFEPDDLPERLRRAGL